MPEGNNGAARIAASVTDSLKGTPALLVLMLINVAFLGLIYLGERDLGAQQHERLQALLQMVDRCIGAK